MVCHDATFPILEQIAVGAGRQRLEQMLVVVIDAGDDETRAGRRQFHIADQLDARAIGQAEIDQGQPQAAAARIVFRPCPGLAQTGGSDDIEARKGRLQKAGQTVAIGRLVLDHETEALFINH